MHKDRLLVPQALPVLSTTVLGEGYHELYCRIMS